MLQSLDIFTLGVCSILESAAFGSVLLVLWSRRPSEQHLLHWGVSNWLYAAILVIFYLHAGHYLAVSTVLQILLGVSDILMVSGVYRMDDERPFRRWMIVPLLAPAVGHVVPRLLGHRGWMLPEIGEALGLAVAMGLCGFAILRESGDFAASRGRKLAGLALLAYVPGYLSVVALRLWFPESDPLLSRIPILSDQVLLGMLNLGLLAIPTERAHQRLREAALRDPLTGSWNREGLADLAPTLLAQGSAVIAIDIDHFKSINDRHGHGAGDDVLVTVAQAAREAAEAADGALFRIGGDEFVAIVPACPVAKAEAIARSIRRAGREGQPLPNWTVSIGIAVFDGPTPTVETAIRRADHALYRAKALGRDRSVIGDPRITLDAGALATT